MNKITILIALGFVILACKNNPKTTETPVSATPATQYFGDTISKEGVLSVQEVMTSLATNDSVVCAIKGYVTSVCKVKGCWMTLAQNQNDTTGFFVKFKDYGFFVPKDLTGEVTVRGVAFKEITSVEELKHYAEDEGKSKEEIDAITQPQEEMKFLATGVMVEPKMN
ncbi:MAG: DUF4920 domain-containing protein [Saprospiraceae bacterium]|nr:DUF4920 domain-containing protein [Saprospiraceae bacterium]